MGYVIPLVLKEEDVDLLSDEQLATLASCSRTIIVTYIKDYIANSSNEAVKARIRKAYSYYILQQEFLTSDGTRDVATALNELKYDMISILMSKEDLLEYKNKIDVVFESEYSVPYLSPINKDIVDSLISELSSNKGDSAKVQLAKRLKQYRTYFKSEQNQSAKGTILKSIMRNRIKYEIIQSAINWVLEQKENNVSPDNWRLL